MPSATRPSRASQTLRLLGGTIAAGVASGAGIAVLAFLVARYGPSGPGWSFRGNGALAVYPLVLPALAGGWTGLGLHHRGRRRWPAEAVGVALVGALLVALSAAVLPVLYRSSLSGPLTLLFLLLALLWTLLMPAWVAIGGAGGSKPRKGAAAHVAAAAAWLLAVAAGLVATGLVVPAGS